MKFLSRITVMLILAAAILGAVGGNSQPRRPDVSVKISLDSAHLLMGRVTPLHVEVTTSRNYAGYLHASGDTLTEGVEVASRTTPDTSDLGGGRIRVTQDLVIQSFDSGDYVIPPVKYIVAGDTIVSNQLALRVVPTPVDTLSTIHDYAAPATLKAHFWDWVPQWISDNWVILLIALLLIAGGVVYYIIYRKRKKGKPVIKLRPAPKPVPPYELALQELGKLREEKLCENGNEKEFYTRLTDILRRYIDARFNINAVEMTSSQILRALRSNPEAKLSEVHMRHILEIADYVKFAKMRPFSDDNQKAFADATRFVEDTRPRPESAPESTDQKPLNPKS